MKKIILLASLLMYVTTQLSAQRKKDSEPPKYTLEEIAAQCENTPRANRVRIAVSSFKVATNSAPHTFGKEMKEMLENAMQNVNCFNVLASLEDQEELDMEISNAQSGRVANDMGPKVGKMKGPQIIVNGKITEYAEGGKTTNSYGGFSMSSSKKAHIGFIVKLIDAETREVIASKSMDIDGSAGGMRSIGIRGFNRSEENVRNKSLQDAMEEGVIQMVEFIASKKGEFELPETEASMKAKKVETTLADCRILKGSKVPKVMVILPEFHITRRIPDPAAETEINRKLLEFGFDVVDAAMFATIANGERFEQAAKDPKKAISLGKEFGADIVVYGEAFSELSTNGGGRNGQVSCRARAEIKAVRTDNAAMLAANGLEAGGLDNVESVASKTALRNAGGLVADYLIEQLCKRGW